LAQLGIRQARYFGERKTLFQLLKAATMENLTLIAAKTGQMRATISRFFYILCLAGSPARGDQSIGWWAWISGSRFSAAIGCRRF